MVAHRLYLVRGDASGGSHRGADWGPPFRASRFRGFTHIEVINVGASSSTSNVNLLKGPAHCAVKPPSSASVAPVTNDAPGEQSHNTAAAISSGLPRRPIGWTRSIFSRGVFARTRSIIAVST